MAESHNLFSLLHPEDDDASTIVDAALAAVNAVKSQDKKKLQNMVDSRKKKKKGQTHVNNHMMTKQNPNSLPHVLRRTKGEKPEGEGSVGDYRKRTENPHPVANWNNGHSNNGSFQGNFRDPRPYYNNRDQNNYGGGGFQGNSRSNFGGNNGYRGDSRGPRNWRYSSNDLQGDNVAVNDEKTENVVVDGTDGWQQVSHNRRRSSDNQSQDGGDMRRNFNGYYGGDHRRGRGYRSNGTDDKSDVSEKDVRDIVVVQQPQTDNGETISVNGAAKDSDEISTVSEGQKDGKDGLKAPVDTKKQDDDKVVFTLKEYEKMQLEKRKALESLKQAEEQRKVELDKDFESMLLVEKNNDHHEEEVAVKQNSEVANKIIDNIKEDITGKAMSIVLKPASFRDEWIKRRQIERLEAERRRADAEKMNNAAGAKNEEAVEVKETNYNTRRQNYNGNGRAGDVEATKRQNYYGNGRARSFSIDANQFPALGGATKR